MARLASTASHPAFAIPGVYRLRVTMGLSHRQKPSNDSRWEHLFKTVLKDTRARPFVELQARGCGKEVVR
jgi:hypothetical protein